MDLSKITNEDYRAVQFRVRSHITSNLKELFDIDLEPLEQYSLNEITRNLLESYIGSIDDFKLDIALKGSKEWRVYDSAFDLDRDAFALFLRCYNIEFMDYLNYQSSYWFKEEFKRRRDTYLIV